jgi:hypothetical protein
MPYIGNTIRAADDYRLIDDISSGFNGSETSFALQVAGSAPVPFPKSPQQVLISVNGVIQEPDPTGSSGFNLVGTNIVFSSAPTNGHAFFGIIYATADYLNAGGNFPAGSLGAPSITFIGDENTGLFRKSGGSVGFVSDATEIANFDSNGITISSGNIIIPDSIIHNGDSNTKIRFPAADTITAETGGSERVRVDSSGNVGIATTSGGGKLAILSNSSTYEGLELQTPSGDGSGEFHIGVHQSGATSGRTIVFKRGGADGMDTESMRIDSSGNVGIGTASPDGKLSVTGNIVCNSGNIRCNGSFSSDVDLTLTADANNNAGNSIIFKESTSEKMRITSLGNVLVGASSSIEVASSAEAQMQITQASDGSRLGLALISIFNGSGPAAVLALGHGRGSTSGALQDNDSVGQIRFAGGDGTDCQTHAASINCEVDGTPSGNVMPGALFFNTNPGSGSTIERMRINSSGSVLVGTTSDSIFNDTSGGGFNLKAGGQLVIAKQATSAADPLVWLNDTGQTTNKSIVFAQDGSEKANIGLAGNNVTISVNGSERMRIASDGKVGIGGTTPDTAFHIEKLTPELRVQSTNTNLGQGSTVCTFSHHTSDPTTPTGVGEVFRIKSYSANSNGADYTTELVSRAGSGGGQSRIALGQGAVGAITFSTNASSSATERMRIDKDGKVGIGVSSPTAKLHIGDNDSGTTDMLILHANADGAGENNGIASIKLMGDSEHAAFIKGGHTSNGNTILTFHTDAHDSGKNPQERMRILDDGGVVINATSRPVVGTEFLGVNGGGANNSVGIAATCSDNNGIPFFASNGSNTTSQRLMRFAAGSGGDTRGTITFNGSAMVYGGASDYRLKENITSISNGITKLKDLKPINFNWIKDETNTSIMGFLAHEVQEVMPQVVVGTKDEVNSEGKPEYQEIDLGGISPLIVAALQEAVAKIETLETEVAALKAA